MPEKADLDLLEIVASKLSEAEFRILPWCIYKGAKDPETGRPVGLTDKMQDLTPYTLVKLIDKEVFAKVVWSMALVEKPKITLKQVKAGLHIQSIFVLWSEIMARFTVRVPLSEGDESEEEDSGSPGAEEEEGSGAEGNASIK
jgi:hypothetical protein